MRLQPSKQARKELINGLTDLVAFLEANPDVPVHEYQMARTQFSVFAESHEQGMADIKSIAANLDVEPKPFTTNTGRRTASATRTFGPVELCFFYIEEEDGES